MLTKARVKIQLKTVFNFHPCFALCSLNYLDLTDDSPYTKPLPLTQLRALYPAEFTTGAARQKSLSTIAISTAMSSSFVLLDMTFLINLTSLSLFFLAQSDIVELIDKLVNLDRSKMKKCVRYFGYGMGEYWGVHGVQTLLIG